ncbi:hypothetical protein G6011_03238 [Alternaria panax]|uniref:F-box domain-containing protein n=1 Tax=Alternaria panax TaxID=48097 RepID=A0AAD4IEG6_9PLEO|nr:hypothetical protein G6011_03238 [Alternaria panax]
MRSTRVDSLMNSSPTSTLRKTLTLPDLCDDVLLLICDFLDHNHNQLPLKRLSLANRRLRTLLAPQLFKTIRVIAPLKTLDTNVLIPHLQQHIQTLKMDMFGSLWWWCSGAYVSSSDAIDLFTFIQSLPQLKTLEVKMMSRSLDVFTAAFTDSELLDSGLGEALFELKGVVKLVVNSSAAFLVERCPDLKTLVLKGKSDGEDCAMEKYTELHGLFETVPSPSLRMRNDGGSCFQCAKVLTSFDGSAAWSSTEVAFLTTTFPHLRHLVLRSDSYCYRADVASIMRILGQGLRQLKTLQMSKIEYLDMGYRGVWKRAVMECKTEEARRALWEGNERRRVEAENEVARLAFSGIEALHELWVGKRRVARRLVRFNEEKRDGWMWEREADSVGDYALVGTMWAKYQKEREGVVERSELGM